MTLAEHEFMGQLLLGLVLVFFLLVLPIGLLLGRKKKNSPGSPETPHPPEPRQNVARSGTVWETPADGLDMPPPLPGSDMPPGKKGFGAPSKLDLLGVGFYVLLFVGMWKIARGGAVGEISTGLVVANALSFIVLASLIPAAVFWRTRLRDFFGLVWKKWTLVFAIAPVFVVGMLLLAAALMYLTGYADWVDARFGAKQQEVVRLLKDSWDPVLLVAVTLSAVVVAPIAEEIIFRGYIFRVTREYTGLWGGALFSGILFGVIHFNVLGLPILALFGVALALVYEKTKSIWAPIACHAAFNGFQVGMALLLKYGHLQIPNS